MGHDEMSTTRELPNDPCVRCQKGRVSPIVVEAMHAHEGVTVRFMDEFMRCDSCGREFYTTEQSMARSRAITSALRKSQDGFLTGDEIRAVRLGYELSLPDFERALGVGKNTVGRWERGTVPPTGAANMGLWVAAHRPVVFEEWARLRGVRIKKRPQRGATAAMSTSQAPSTPTITLIGGKDRPIFGAAMNVQADGRPPQESLPIAAGAGEHS